MQAASWGCFFSKKISAEGDLHGGVQCGAIGLVEAAEGFTHEALVEGGEDGLDGGDLQEFSCLPVLHDDLAERGRRAHLAGDGHQDQIGPFGVVAWGLTTTAGRCFAWLWSVKGNGTRKTSPKV